MQQVFKVTVTGIIVTEDGDPGFWDTDTVLDELMSEATQTEVESVRLVEEELSCDCSHRKSCPKK